MRRLTSALSLFFISSWLFACSSESGGGGGGDDTGGQSGSTATGGASGTGTTGGASGTGTTGGASGTGTTGGSSSGGTGTGGAATGGSGTGGSSGGGFTKTGVCGQRSEATVTTTSYTGYEEFYMVSQEALDDGRLDEFSCLIRFDVARSGEAPAGCVDLENVPCPWTHEVTFSNPTVMMDVDGACAKNELGWTTAWMSGLDGSTADYGYIDMYQSHDSVVMKFITGAAGTEMWDVFGRASWDDVTGAFSFDNRIGACQY